MRKLILLKGRFRIFRQMGNKQSPQSPQPPFQDEFNFLERFPKCDPSHREPKMEGDCYAHASALSYSLRNCLAQYDKVIPDDDIMVRTVDDARKANYVDQKPCGSSRGGHAACVAGYFERIDKNPVVRLSEDKVEEELLRKGPIAVTFNTQPGFFRHVKSTDEPYIPNPDQRRTSRHASTIVGFGETNDGEKYWICHDSNVREDQTFLNYRIKQNDSLFASQFISQEIKHPIPFTKKKEQIFKTGEKADTQFLTGALDDDYDVWVRSGLEDAYNKWAERERNQ
jgi:hypothetical protein